MTLALAKAQDEAPLSPTMRSHDQVQSAEDALMLPPEAYFQAPWLALDGMLGGVPPGSLWYVGGFSGHGKTTFLTSLTLDLLARGDSVYYLGLESTPQVLRTHLACKRLGYDAGDLLSGAYRQWPNWEAVRKEVAGALRDDGVQASYRLQFSDATRVDVDVLWAEMEQAAKWGATVFVVDHVDHLQASGAKDLYTASVEVNTALKDGAQELGLRMLVATQFNNEAVKGRQRIGLHTFPLPHYIKNGGHKREVADGILALGRPLKFGIDSDSLKAYQAGHIGQSEVCEPNTMAVYCLKHRLYGSREGARIYLRVDRGRVLDANQELYQSTRYV